MSLFQKTVIDNYLSTVKDEDFDTNWNTFKDYYLKEDTQERIRSKKEEEFQHDFLEFIFDNCLGYNIKDSADQNLFKEVKNVTDSKKADGAIKQGEDIVAVIELKSTKTKDFNEIQKQAFGYKNNHPNCRYVVSSNFQKLRFYIDDATKFEEFDLFKLSKEDFKLLWVCLAKDNLFDGVAKKLKSESILEEESITKKLYKDYSEFRKEIFNNLVESNPEIDKLTLFKKTQKLLDRFLFIFFAEDRGLVPTNSISKIIDQWEDSFTGSDSLYTVFKQYFKLLNEGRPKRGDKEAVFAYNGGLFAEDQVLNSIKIDDDLLFKHTKNLSHYDFRSEVSVDILGHIFEHSLSEIEEIQKEISGEEVEQSKRKKDGIFYTPAYITKYMVENTVGKLCDEKKKELEINEENYSDPKRRTKVRIENLDSYREWLLDLKICDPACGSGAFLNQALNFLIDEHNYIDSLKNSYLGGSIPFSDIENSILENNLYGVDINEESVEIAKLSLWLRTAQKGRKLTVLSKNIKCGNSLIDDPNFAADKAFNWQKEFPDVFANEGFDIVIGNPPYVNVELMPEGDKEYFRKNYTTFFKRSDLFSLFIELATNRLTNKGYISYIIPSIILNNLSYKKTRENILTNQLLAEVCYTGNKVFNDATVDTTILVLDKSKRHKQIELVDALDFFQPKVILVDLDYFLKYDNNISVTSSSTNEITDKIFKDIYEVSDDHFLIFQGVVTGNNDAYIFDNISKAKEEGVDEILLKPMCHGRDISKWKIDNSSRQILYINDNINIDNYPKTKEYLSSFKNKLETRRECRNGVIPWYSLQWPRVQAELDVIPKILIQNTRNERLRPRIVAAIDENGLYGTQGLNFILPTSDYNIYSFLGLLNSKLIDYLFSTKFLNLAIKADYLKKLRFPGDIGTSGIDNKAKHLSSLNNSFSQLTNKFISLMQSKFKIIKLTNKLKDWHELNSVDFFTELEKARKKVAKENKLELKKLSLSEEAEWLQYFSEQKEKAEELKKEINKTDNEIDQIVYGLYGLSQEEIEIVENF